MHFLPEPMERGGLEILLEAVLVTCNGLYQSKEHKWKDIGSLVDQMQFGKFFVPRVGNSGKFDTALFVRRQELMSVF
jgi:hypothetical protein